MFDSNYTSGTNYYLYFTPTKNKTVSHKLHHFRKFISADEPFPKALCILETCVSGNNNIFEKLALTLESVTTLDECFKINSIPFYIPDFSLWTCEWNNFLFEVLYLVILYQSKNKFVEHTNKTFTVTFEKFKLTSFASLTMENTVVLPVLCTFIVRLICWVLLDQHQFLAIYLSLLLSHYNSFENLI